MKRQIAKMQDKVAEHKHQQTLMDALEFDVDDLNANHNGYLSKKQRRKLRRFRRVWKISIALTFMIAVIGLLIAIVDGYRIHDTFSSRFGVCGVIVLIAAGYSYQAYQRIQAFNNDLSKGDIVKISGIISKYNFANRGETAIQINGQIFRGRDYRFYGFQFGEYYTIFYTPFSKYLLSARLPYEPATVPDLPKIMKANPPIT